jgi:phospholipid/cholesterol/gamma-HCH transport system substrate-binding protein
MSRELKLGILTFITLFLAIWGYTFIKGRNMFNPSYSYQITVPDVTGLAVSGEVLVNGYKIGSITDIKLNPQDVKAMDVFFTVDNKIGIPADAEVLVKNDGVMGGKILSLSFTKACTGGECAPSGSKLKSRSVGLLGSMLEPQELTNYVDNTTKSARNLINDLGKEGNDAKLDLIIRNLDASLANMSNSMNSLNRMLVASQNNVTGITSNFNKISKNIADNNAQISSMIGNLNTTTSNLAKADLNGSLLKVNTLVESGNTSVKTLETTLNAATASMNSLNAILTKMDKGDGSLSQLMNDKKLYNNLESTTKNLSLLLQDLRLNPKRYLNVSLIARKDKPYIYPENDPGILDVKSAIIENKPESEKNKQ